jgi:hypothetical protein
MHDLITVFELFGGLINRWDRRGVVAGISLVAAAVVCIVLMVRDHISPWQFAPVAILVLLAVGAFLLIRWRVSTAAELPQPQDASTGLIENREPEPAALSGQAGPAASAARTDSASSLQWVIAGAVGGLIAMFGVDIIFAYSDHSSGLTLLEVARSWGELVVFCAPFTFGLGALLGHMGGSRIQALAFWMGIRGKPLQIIVVGGSFVVGMVGTFIILSMLAVLSYA